MLQEIADAFGLLAESLEPLSDDELVDKACQSCERWERSYAELAAELAECHRDLELHRRQIEALLRSFAAIGR